MTVKSHESALFSFPFSPLFRWTRTFWVRFKKARGSGPDKSASFFFFFSSFPPPPPRHASCHSAPGGGGGGGGENDGDGLFFFSSLPFSPFPLFFLPGGTSE